MSDVNAPKFYTYITSIVTKIQIKIKNVYNFVDSETYLSKKIIPLSCRQRDKSHKYGKIATVKVQYFLGYYINYCKSISIIETQNKFQLKNY